MLVDICVDTLLHIYNIARVYLSTLAQVIIDGPH